MITVYRKADFAAALGINRASLGGHVNLPKPTGVSPDGEIVYWLSTDKEFAAYVKSRSNRAAKMSDG